MKLKLSLVGIALFATQTFALTSQDVERQIQEIQNLPLQQRVEKMNELKSELRNMNEQERNEIIKEIAEKHHIEHTKTEFHMRDSKKHEKMDHKEEHMSRDRGHIGMDRGEMDSDRGHIDMDRGHIDMDRVDMDRDRGHIDMDRGDRWKS